MCERKVGRRGGLAHFLIQMLTGGQIRLEVLEENTNVVRHRDIFHHESLISVLLGVTLTDNPKICILWWVVQVLTGQFSVLAH